MKGNGREMRVILREAAGLGLEVTRRANNHWKIACPGDGRYVIVGSTPGSDGALMRARSQVRRLAAGEPVTAANVDVHCHRA